MSFHLVTLNEVYSNADGSIQYIELLIPNNGEVFIGGHPITITQNAQNNRTYTIPFSPSSVNDGFPKTFLIATQGYADFAAAAGLPTPDTIISLAQFPNGLLFTN